MADNKLEVMEARLSELEQRIFGATDKDIAYPRDSQEIIDTLAGMNNHIHQSISGRNRIEAVMRRLGELEKFLDPAYTDQLALSQEAKAEIILAEEDLLRQQAENLEKVRGMSDVLSSEHIKAVPALEGNLHALSQVHLQQQDAASDLSEEAKALLLKYNNIVTLLSKQFVQWDEVITKMEAQAQTTKVQD